jgi:hypothetical protein
MTISVDIEDSVMSPKDAVRSSRNKNKLFTGKGDGSPKNILFSDRTRVVLPELISITEQMTRP